RVVRMLGRRELQQWEVAVALALEDVTRGDVAPVPDPHVFLRDELHLARAARRDQVLVNAAVEAQPAMVAEQPELADDRANVAELVGQALAAHEVAVAGISYAAQAAQRAGGLLHQLFVGIDPHHPFAAGALDRGIPSRRE